MRFANQALKSVGPLEVLELGNPMAEWTVVLLHGFGADAYDLASLVDEWGFGKSLRFVFLQGPLVVPVGPMMTGRAWFPIDMAAHERAAAEGADVDYSGIRPRGADEATRKVIQCLKELGVAPEKMALGGFSQGAMLSVDVALNMPKAPRGLVLMSGVLVDERSVRMKASALKGLRYFQSHGRGDPVLPFSGAERLHLALEEAGWTGYLTEFRGGHEIPLDVVRGVKSFLKSLFSL